MNTSGRPTTLRVDEDLLAALLTNPGSACIALLPITERGDMFGSCLMIQEDCPIPFVLRLANSNYTRVWTPKTAMDDRIVMFMTRLGISCFRACCSLWRGPNNPHYDRFCRASILDAFQNEYFLDRLHEWLQKQKPARRVPITRDDAEELRDYLLALLMLTELQDVGSVIACMKLSLQGKSNMWPSIVRAERFLSQRRRSPYSWAMRVYIFKAARIQELGASKHSPELQLMLEAEVEKLALLRDNPYEQQGYLGGSYDKTSILDWFYGLVESGDQVHDGTTAPANTETELPALEYGAKTENDSVAESELMVASR
ncbi:hypothetical protein EJ04DRAFT_564757 [Polyplosphaeria fusca]|uniref:Uncharacterized protein n=1 Tax=Polyplosphaeria fusca TaxID=682080 RepID=A0A9P4QYN9_9PLEO|nr:hypothetical protein EJ04DRAFT_564757 [Polyplosphaeria fusca]